MGNDVNSLHIMPKLLILGKQEYVWNNVYISGAVLWQGCQIVCEVLYLFSNTKWAVLHDIYGLLILNPSSLFQGAQEMFSALPCEFVEPHELKEVSRSGGMQWQ